MNLPRKTLNQWQGKRVIIIGAARQGLAAARYLTLHHAKVILNDRRPKELLTVEMNSLSHMDIEWVSGGHPIEIMSPKPDLVCISGGVPDDNPLVLMAKRENIRLSNDTQIFMESVPCKTIGITGSAGKTTTTTLVGRIANSACGLTYQRIWIGGNIGDPLINYLDEMQPDDLAILEISSFQSELMTTSPNVAAILNITPNHLDRHKTMENYINAKSRVINFQNEDDITILGRDATPLSLAEHCKGHLLTFGFSPLADGKDGAYIDDGKFYFRDKGVITRLPVEDLIELRGEHNRLNVLAACCIAFAAGFDTEAMIAGVKGFHGVPHRLEFVRNWHGAAWYNDSIATAPERTIAAIKAFETPIILLLGGRDKDLPWNELANLTLERVDHVVIFGEEGEKIEASLIGAGGKAKQNELASPLRTLRDTHIIRVNNCHEAVIAASKLAQPGLSVLFSPGGTSYDEFKDFEERGERYRQWVLEF